MSDSWIGDDRVVVVGERNPYGGDPAMALVNYPTGCAGYNLWRILGLPEERYLALSRLNLCAGPWDRGIATTAAAATYARLPDPDVTLVALQPIVLLLGARVADAFRQITIRPEPGGRLAPGGLGELQEGADAGGLARWIRLPHPSGLCRSWGPGMWSAGGSVERVRMLLAQVAPHVPWGTDHRMDLRRS